MTLKDKFDNPIMRHDLGRNNTEQTKEQCAEIADDFAIGFINWYAMHGSWIEENLTSKELLEIYKKEQGL